MENYAPVWALGLMSGTSVDGIDIAAIKTNGESVVSFGPADTFPYSPALRKTIIDNLGKTDVTSILVHEITMAHYSAIKIMLSKHKILQQKVRLIGMHGHTIHHDPQNKITKQIGDGAQLAEKSGTQVVCDFRSCDVAAGGQGAPLVPLYHQALSQSLKKPLAVINIGGISNITWIDESKSPSIIAFDTGPGNALLDQWVHLTTNHQFDVNGAVSKHGHVNHKVLSQLKQNDYFQRRPPKSLDRLDFSIDILSGLSPADGAATLIQFTCDTIVEHFKLLPVAPTCLFVTGGGRKNPVLMQVLKERAAIQVLPVEHIGWDGDSLEAQAFAFLAVRAFRGLPLSLPSTTGVPEPLTGGQIFNPINTVPLQNCEP